MKGTSETSSGLDDVHMEMMLKALQRSQGIKLCLLLKIKLTYIRITGSTRFQNDASQFYPE